MRRKTQKSQNESKRCCKRLKLTGPSGFNWFTSDEGWQLSLYHALCRTSKLYVILYSPRGWETTIVLNGALLSLRFIQWSMNSTYYEAVKTLHTRPLLVTSPGVDWNRKNIPEDFIAKISLPSMKKTSQGVVKGRLHG